MPKAVPVDYQSTVKKPADFDAFWNGVLQQAAAVPLEPEMISDPLRTSAEVEVFQVFYTSLEHVRIAAWYCRPTHRAERIPAVLLLPGYQADPPIPKEWALKGYGALSVAPRSLQRRPARPKVKRNSRSSQPAKSPESRWTACRIIKPMTW